MNASLDLDLLARIGEAQQPAAAAKRSKFAPRARAVRVPCRNARPGAGRPLRPLQASRACSASPASLTECAVCGRGLSPSPLRRLAPTRRPPKAPPTAPRQARSPAGCRVLSGVFVSILQQWYVNTECTTAVLISWTAPRIAQHALDSRPVQLACDDRVSRAGVPLAVPPLAPDAAPPAAAPAAVPAPAAARAPSTQAAAPHAQAPAPAPVLSAAPPAQLPAAAPPAPLPAAPLAPAPERGAKQAGKRVSFAVDAGEAAADADGLAAAEPGAALPPAQKKPR